MPRYSVDQLKALQDVLQRYSKVDVAASTPDTGIAAKDMGVFEGVRQIFEAPSSCHIAELLRGRMRLGLSFVSYDCSDIIGAAGAKRTIEFRFMDGVIDSWAETMARICVGLVRFAIQSSVDDYVDVLRSCDRYDRGDSQYDVIDLLDNLYLFAEAEAAEGRIRRFQSEWGLKYVSSE